MTAKEAGTTADGNWFEWADVVHESLDSQGCGRLTFVTRAIGISGSAINVLRERKSG